MRCRFILVLSMLLIFNLSILHSVSPVKISDDASEKIQDGNVSVFIKLNSESKTIQSEKLSDSIKIDHEFEGMVSATISEKDLTELELNPNVESVGLVGVKKIFLQDSVPLINATSVWSIQMNNLNLTGAGETVCILDTGANFSHPDLIGKNLTCVIDCINEACIQNCSISDDNGHGTHVAGIVSANGLLKGVAPESNLIAVKVCNSTGSCRDDWVRAGIDWCVNNYQTYNISVISMSLGSGQYDYYCDGIDDPFDITRGINNAVAKNISVVVATGNIDGTYTTASAGIASPACIRNATCVTATDKSDNFTYYAFRNKNFTDILVAPGGTSSRSGTCSPGNMDSNRICSTSMAGNYISYSGTSMATPHVAGAIALINQFKKLELNKLLTPSQIKNSLNISGKQIYDSETGINFSRIDVYSAILYLDETPPNVTLVSPQNNTINSSLNQIFSCNATDTLQLANLTLQIWNSTADIYFENTTNASSNFLSLENNVILEFGQYTWNCVALDKNNNIVSLGNFTLIIGSLSVNLISPTDNPKTNSNQTFNCSASSIDELSNVTFYLWNSTDLKHNETKNISGTQNSTFFDYNFASEGNYSWNCEFFSENNFSSANSNYSLTYDITKPNISLLSPADSYSTTETSINFQFNASDNFEINNCSLLINDISLENNQSQISNSTNTIQHILSVGSYNWKINCVDDAGNSQNSSQRNLIINSPPSGSSSGSSGGGGGSMSSSKTITLTEDEIKQGTTKELQVNDKLSFSIGNQSHELKLNSIAESVTITISSNPITLTLAVNQSRKINLDNDGFYDLEISLLSVANAKIKIEIKEIHGEIPVKKIFSGNESESDSLKITGNIVNENKSALGFIFDKIAGFFKNIFEWIKGNFN